MISYQLSKLMERILYGFEVRIKLGMQILMGILLIHCYKMQFSCDLDADLADFSMKSAYLGFMEMQRSQSKLHSYTP